MRRKPPAACRAGVAPLTGSVDRNGIKCATIRAWNRSLPSRGAWIEMRHCQSKSSRSSVAPLTGSVDRNSGKFGGGVKEWLVAPLTGSVDRNKVRLVSARPGLVAPLTGSVDRNFFCSTCAAGPAGSLPSRGAWIEMARTAPDRTRKASLPSRGAWIEMAHRRSGRRLHPVAPLTGSVDRNVRGDGGGVEVCLSLPSRGAWIEIISRSTRRNNVFWSLPSRGAWIEIV